jgi:hypothetical protein
VSDDDQSSNLLYHYTTTQGLIGILESDCLWATDVRFLSDASEASYGREVAVEALGVAIEAAQNEQRLLSLKIAADYFTDELGPDTSSIVVCFSEQPDHLSQWQAYGRGGGFAIGFDRSNLERPRTPAHRHPFKRDARPFQLVPVIYDRAAQLRAAAETIREHLDHPKMTNFGPGEELVGALFPQVAVFKNAAFEEEREWRAMTDVIVNFYPLKFRPSSWGPVPYGTFPLRVADSVESPIREVRVGPSAHPDTVRTGVQLLLKSHDLDVPVISSEVPLR